MIQQSTVNPTGTNGHNPEPARSSSSKQEEYGLVRLATGVATIRCTGLGETFHPVIGPEAEAKALYSGQLARHCGTISAQKTVTIWDVGLGGAANPITVIKSLAGSQRPIKILSFDHTLAPMRFALANSSELGYLEGWETWLESLANNRQVSFDWNGLQIDWSLHLGDFPTLLRSREAESWAKPAGILFDAFSPSRNAAMWTLPLFTRIYQLLSPEVPCMMPTYSRSTLLRATLLLAGFFAGVGKATGEKEETTIASNSLACIERPLDQAWLQRCRKSTSAEPLHEPVYRQQPLTDQSWNKLLLHPQFETLNKRPAPELNTGFDERSK